MLGLKLVCNCLLTIDEDEEDLRHKTEFILSLEVDVVNAKNKNI